MTKACMICGKPVEHGRQCYCSEECAKKGERQKDRERGRRKRIRKTVFRSKVCADCGKAYRGHFNSKYCDTCLTERHMKYYENRVFLEEDAG